MPPCHDLHTHSTASDGSFSPAELVREASGAGITHLALSDHDTTAGLAEAARAADEAGLHLIPAVEISATWMEKSIHIVGLRIDPSCPELQEGLEALRSTRLWRAEEMGRRLDKHGIPGAFEAASSLTPSGMVTRTHFARVILAHGLAASLSDVFNRYLTHGKPGYVSTRWADLEQVVSWIRQAGGTAVVAHPQRYKLTASWMRRLLGEFKEMGGAALEVVAGSAHAQEVQAAASHARRFGLMASAGSDFHSPEHPWLKLGRLPPLPADLKPVWSLWRE